jgi:hypothetical protein
MVSEDVVDFIQKLINQTKKMKNKKMVIHKWLILMNNNNNKPVRALPSAVLITTTYHFALLTVTYGI